MDDFPSFGISDGSCCGFDVEMFNNTFTCAKNLFILNFNIRSFNSNIDEFYLFINELNLKPDIVVLTETWFAEQSTANLEGYYGYHCTRLQGHLGGGVSIYIKMAINPKVIIQDVCSLPEIEFLRLNVVLNNRKNFDIIAIYRPPVGSITEGFLPKIDELLSVNPNRNTILVGDLNICGLRRTNTSENFIDLLRTYSFFPHISIPTRPNLNGESTLIDHIWSNFALSFTGGVFSEVYMTDHLVNFVVIPDKIENEKVKITFRDHSDENVEKMAERLINFKLFFPLLTANMDFDGEFDLFFEEINRIYKISCPIRTKEISHERFCKPWLNHYHLLKIKIKHYLLKRYKNGAIPYAEFKSFSLETDKIIKKAKRDYYTNKLDSCAKNPKEVWKITNNLLGRNSKSPAQIEINDGLNVISDEVQICTIFNEYFTNVGKSLVEGISSNGNLDPLSYMGNRCQNSFFLRETNATEVTKIFLGFTNKKTGLNNIPIKILKKVLNIISPMLSDLFNESIKHGLFPRKLKLGRVVPIHKTGSQKLTSNYRPISTLSVLSKVFEKLLHKRITNFLTKFKLINKTQFGFQKGKCTSDAILEFLDNAYESLNNKKYLLAIFLDFSKAFDTISHDILLKKLEYMGFRGPILNILKSYLSNRKQFVSIGGSTSETLETTIGVPQGSTLGPLLFIIYINDMKNSLSHLKVVHFADDSTLYLDYNKNSDISPQINSELNEIKIWLMSNKLYLNVSKTKYMIISNRDGPINLNLKIGDDLVQRIDTYKFLGVFIDDRLTFSTHTSKISSKVSQAVGMIRKMSSIVPKNILRQLHFALVYSKFNYAITAYGSACQNSIKRLSNLVNRSIKLITYKRTITQEVCNTYNLFNFQMTFKYFISIKMFQIVKLRLHDYFINKIDELQIEHDHETRSRTNESYRLPLFKFRKCQRSFLFIGIKFWNDLPISVKAMENLQNFKRHLRENILQI